MPRYKEEGKKGKGEKRYRDKRGWMRGKGRGRNGRKTAERILG